MDGDIAHLRHACDVRIRIDEVHLMENDAYMDVKMHYYLERVKNCSAIALWEKEEALKAETKTEAYKHLAEYEEWKAYVRRWISRARENKCYIIG